MCRPFGENPDYFYPARKEVSLFYAATILAFPYVLDPTDPAILIYTRCFCVILYPVCFATLISKYFQLTKHRKSPPVRIAYILSPFILIIAMLVPILAGCDSWIPEHETEILFTAGIISLLLTTVTGAVLLSLKKEMDRYNTENYSNNEDFPYKFAIKAIYLPVLWLVLMWVVFLTGDRWINFVADIATSAVMVYFLSVILHPQKIVQPGEVEKELNKLQKEKNQDILKIERQNAEERTAEDEDDTPMDVIEAEVLAVVLRRFREPHLLKTEVLMELGNGKMNRASKFISSIGYYKLVNMFRLEYARLYKEAHPNAKQEEIALEAGFVSRTAYYKAKRDVGEIDRQLTKGVKLA